VAAKQNLLKQAEKLEGTSPDVPKFFGSAGALPSKKKPFAIRHSLFATRHSLLFHYSPIDIHHRFPTCRFADLTICR
jgi:hypothetical protein